MNNRNNAVATWEAQSVGTSITTANSVQEALEQAGLNYEVVKAPVYLSNGYKIPNQYCTKKKNTNEVFGIVGKDYTIIQNRDAFDFVDAIIPEGLSFVKAGESSWMNWLLAKLPDEYILGDKMTPYVIFQNSHSGGTTMKASISNLRIACQNQFTTAFRQSKNKVSIRHTASAIEKLHSAQEVLALTARNMGGLREFAEQAAVEKVSESQAVKVIEALFPINDNDSTRKVNSMVENRQLFTNAMNADDLANFKGTKWGMLNAYTDFITHKEAGRATDSAKQSRFINVTMNTSLVESFMNILERV